MAIPQQIAKHFQGVYFGGNWTTTNLKDTLADVTWQQATTQVYSFNTIATLVYHIHYYVRVALQVLQGKPLNANDKYSFSHPPIHSQEEWDTFVTEIWSEAQTFATLLEQVPDGTLEKVFVNEKYGTYYRNLHGIIEHTHYHLGQIALIKKIVQQEGTR